MLLNIVTGYMFISITQTIINLIKIFEDNNKDLRKSYKKQ